eukprot:761454-Hanusia_phi.AAC.2
MDSRASSASKISAFMNRLSNFMQETLNPIFFFSASSRRFCPAGEDRSVVPTPVPSAGRLREKRLKGRAPRSFSARVPQTKDLSVS